MRDMEGFLEQKNISAKNVARLRELCESSNADVRRRAEIILEVALIKPHRRKRTWYIHEKRPDLFARLVQGGLFVEWDEGPELNDDPVVEEWAGAGDPRSRSSSGEETAEEILTKPFEEALDDDNLPY